jgi:hypothetical protein
MKEETVTYVRKGPVVVLKNSAQLPLVFGRSVYRATRWVVGSEVFKTLRRSNSHVKLPEGDFRRDSRCGGQR